MRARGVISSSFVLLPMLWFLVSYRTLVNLSNFFLPSRPLGYLPLNLHVRFVHSPPTIGTSAGRSSSAQLWAQLKVTLRERDYLSGYAR